jgi:hypothetical protein
MQAIGADANNWDKCFKLMADIDLGQFTGDEFNIIGNGDNPFTGVFDGNGHTISNFTYVTATRIHFVGIFGATGEISEVKDLGLIDPNVDAGTSWYVGSLVGGNSGTVTGCYVDGGCVLGRGIVGILVGDSDGTITNCQSRSVVSGNDRVGGLVGLNRGIITNCYTSSSVSSVEWIGGQPVLFLVILGSAVWWERIMMAQSPTALRPVAFRERRMLVDWWG